MRHAVGAATTRRYSATLLGCQKIFKCAKYITIHLQHTFLSSKHVDHRSTLDLTGHKRAQTSVKCVMLRVLQQAEDIQQRLLDAARRTSEISNTSKYTCNIRFCRPNTWIIVVRWT
jgi:hypothetical protein